MRGAAQHSFSGGHRISLLPSTHRLRPPPPKLHRPLPHAPPPPPSTHTSSHLLPSLPLLPSTHRLRPPPPKTPSSPSTCPPSSSLPTHTSSPLLPSSLPLLPLHPQVEAPTCQDSIVPFRMPAPSPSEPFPSVPVQLYCRARPWFQIVVFDVHTLEEVGSQLRFPYTISR